VERNPQAFSSLKMQIDGLTVSNSHARSSEMDDIDDEDAPGVASSEPEPEPQPPDVPSPQPEPAAWARTPAHPVPEKPKSNKKRAAKGTAPRNQLLRSPMRSVLGLEHSEHPNGLFVPVRFPLLRESGLIEAVGDGPLITLLALYSYAWRGDGPSAVPLVNVLKEHGYVCGAVGQDQIADELGRSRSTVEEHVKLWKKLCALRVARPPRPGETNVYVMGHKHKHPSLTYAGGVPLYYEFFFLDVIVNVVCHRLESSSRRTQGSTR